MDFSKLKDNEQLFLYQLYSQEIKRNEESRKNWIQERDKHKKIIDGLQTVVSELSVNCMVPLGKRAFMKGKLTHTNEILVCIGGGYLVKYSAQQAIDLCNRRIQRSEEMLEKIEKERNLLEIRQMLPLDYDAFESGDSKDLIEYWDDKQLEEWRVQHRKREKEYRQNKSEVDCFETKENVNENENDLFERLNQLELEEELADEINRLEECQDTYEHNYKNNDEKNEKEVEKQKNQNVILNTDIVDEQIDIDSKLQIDQSRQMDDIKSKSNQKTNRSAIIDTKINGKFEVSIIKEDEITRVLESPNSPINSYSTLKSPSCNEHKQSRPNWIDEIESHIHNEKLKNGGKKVSFAEPDNIEVKTDEDNIIKIGFKHSEMKSSFTDSHHIISPKDIYRIYCKPKSILKRSLTGWQNNEVTLSNDSFQENITENCVPKSIYSMVVQDVEEKNINKVTAEIPESIEKKKSSRFKLERINMKK